MIPFCVSNYGKIFSASLQVILIDGCSVSSCNFGVPMGGDEFRVSLFHHLRTTSWFLKENPKNVINRNQIHTYIEQMVVARREGIG